MKTVRARYLIKCDIPGCSNVAKNIFSQGDDVKVNVSLKNRTMNLRIAPYGVVWLKL